MIPAEFALIDQPELALKLRCQLIRGARSRIQAQYYSWEEDSSGKLLLSELLHAAKRGVRVQLLIDDLYAGDNRFLEMVAHQPGIEVRLFNPFWLRGWRPLTLLLEGLLSFRRINHRMHNKLLLVDGSQAVIGGRNIGDRYFGLGGAPQFVDLDLACRGPLCQRVEQGFDQFWRSRWSHPIRRLLRRPLQRAEVQVVNDFLLTLNEPQISAVYDLPASLFDPEPIPLCWHAGRAEVWFDRPGKGLVSRPTTARLLWRKLADNQGTLRLVTPYLILTRGLRRRLRQQRQAGVTIDILTNSLASTDVPLVYGAYRRHRPWLIRQGIALSELEGASLSLHAKLILVGEEEALLGSFNLDPRSLLLNTELVLHLACPALCAELQQWLTTWQQRSSHSVAAPPSTLRRLLARVSDWLPLQRWL
ncbi:phospholipase D family protein [Aeromonas dhakensis]|uniref:phospholipase D family protein n=1 Tax=Aeromonas TaxID=642 RepID=UPI00191F2EFD|nr:MULTISPECIES: phospholipase D family protein [Aeromonas]MDD9308615.1 phospholipase D family protein [Aeromonas hydrophila]MBL0462057.1 phospholipase D family protein [Aeromonas dhakensis]MBL0603114.1 phospholipase D family protein [Aeromonas dhakensis]MBL0619173.1 phospholipase D family protein [Aeromonas dhakensis]MBL0659763.1 phospholipase D family protein [Aeromonas dhakensis]